MNRSQFTLSVFTISILFATGVRVEAQGIYWSGGGTIRIADLDGSHPRDLIENPLFGPPQDLAVDEVSSRLVFFANTGSGNPNFYETNLYGTSQLSVTMFPRDDQNGLAISSVTGAIYAASQGNCNAQRSVELSRIFRRTSVPHASWQPIDSEEFTCNSGLALDDAGGKIYWTEFLFKKVMRSNLDGSDTEALVTSTRHPQIVAVDSEGGKMYWADIDTIYSAPFDSWIWRADLDGSNQTLLHSGLPAVNGISLDVKHSKLYWTTATSVMRSNLDGSVVETIVTEGGFGIAVVTCSPSKCGGLKNRFLSYDAGHDSHAASAPVAIRVKLVDLSQFPAMNGQVYWVAPHTTTQDTLGNETFAAARLQCSPNVQNWTSAGLIHLYGPEIVPGSTYEVRYATAACAAQGEESCLSEAKIVQTGLWGDIIAPFDSPQSTIQQPDFGDIAACVNKFSESPGACRTRAKLSGEAPDPSTQVDFADISALVDAFQGRPYPYAGPIACP